MRPTITIRFHSKFQIIAQLFDLIRFKMKKNTIRTALIVIIISPADIFQARHHDVPVYPSTWTGRGSTMTATNHDGHKQWPWRPQPWWPQTMTTTATTMTVTNRHLFQHYLVSNLQKCRPVPAISESLKFLRDQMLFLLANWQVLWKPSISYMRTQQQRQRLCSSTYGDLCVPCIATDRYGWQAFAVSGPQLRNQLSAATRATCSDTPDCFKWALKTSLWASATEPLRNFLKGGSSH